MSGTYLVMCRVSGGITGTREAPLKEGGYVKYFNTLDDAKSEADVLNEMRAQGDMYRSARFKYWAEEV
jgi:hypothetical protein